MNQAPQKLGSLVFSTALLEVVGRWQRQWRTGEAHASWWATHFIPVFLQGTSNVQGQLENSIFFTWQFIFLVICAIHRGTLSRKKCYPMFFAKPKLKVSVLCETKVPKLCGFFSLLLRSNIKWEQYCFEGIFSTSLTNYNSHKGGCYIAWFGKGDPRIPFQPFGHQVCFVWRCMSFKQ